MGVMLRQSAILNVDPLGFQWPVFDPFLFCVHHLDYYPAGNELYGPKASLVGRQLGQDFIQKDGWRMYHGKNVPGFPGHPHRGFETVTVVEKGIVDHADSMGAAGRYGNGDIQWMTAGSGIQHSEMFPLLKTQTPNTLELFQIWLNLPSMNKMVEPHFKMFWDEQVPRITLSSGVRLKVIAGSYSEEFPALSPPPDSWAAKTVNEVVIWIIEIEKGGEITLPLTNSAVLRNLYFFQGNCIFINDREITAYNRVEVMATEEVKIIAPKEKARLLLLQGKPISEPVAQYGPFVMNTKTEISAAFTYYQNTQFGGWPWKVADPVHDDKERFAKYSNGEEDLPPS